MSLAARCHACHTAFRVVPDQLRVSDGWVRCGRCGEVFNANDTLFHLRALAAPALQAGSTPQPMPAPPAEEVPAEVVPAEVVPAEEIPAEEVPAEELQAEALPAGDVQAEDVTIESNRGDAADEIAAGHGPVEQVNAPPAEPIAEPTGMPPLDGTPEPTLEPELPPPMPGGEPAWVEGAVPPEEASAPSPSVEGGEHDRGAPGGDVEPALPPDEPAAAPATAPVDDAAPQATGADERIEPSLATPTPEAVEASDDATPTPTDAAAPAAEASATPAFVREAERAERWQSPEMRALLGGAAVLLAGAALIQGLRGFHAPLTAEWPQTRTWVEPLCRLAGCRVEPPRRLDALSVEGSSLVQLDGGALTRLSLVLRNRDRNEVLLPAIELTLTDVQGTVVARKVFAAGELGAPGAAIAGGAELALQGVLDTGGLPVVGYTIELFYP